MDTLLLQSPQFSTASKKELATCWNIFRLQTKGTNLNPDETWFDFLLREHSHAVNIALSKHLDTSKYIPITGSLNSERMLPRRWQLDKPSSTVPDRDFPLLAFIDPRKDAGNGAQVLGIDHESSVDPWEVNMDH